MIEDPCQQPLIQRKGVGLGPRREAGDTRMTCLISIAVATVGGKMVNISTTDGERRTFLGPLNGIQIPP